MLPLNTGSARVTHRVQPACAKRRIACTPPRLAREAAGADRYKRIALDTEAVDRLVVDVFVGAHASALAQIAIGLRCDIARL